MFQSNRRSPALAALLLSLSLTTAGLLGAQAAGAADFYPDVKFGKAFVKVMIYQYKVMARYFTDRSAANTPEEIEAALREFKAMMERAKREAERVATKKPEVRVYNLPGHARSINEIPLERGNQLGGAVSSIDYSLIRAKTAEEKKEMLDDWRDALISKRDVENRIDMLDEMGTPEARKAAEQARQLLARAEQEVAALAKKTAKKTVKGLGHNVPGIIVFGSSSPRDICELGYDTSCGFIIPGGNLVPGCSSVGEAICNGLFDEMPKNVKDLADYRIPGLVDLVDAASELPPLSGDGSGPANPLQSGSGDKPAGVDDGDGDADAGVPSNDPPSSGGAAAPAPGRPNNPGPKGKGKSGGLGNLIDEIVKAINDTTNNTPSGSDEAPNNSDNTSNEPDNDGDGTPDSQDLDDDNDGTNDESDLDSDGDGKDDDQEGEDENENVPGEQEDGEDESNDSESSDSVDEKEGYCDQEDQDCGSRQPRSGSASRSSQIVAQAIVNGCGPDANPGPDGECSAVKGAQGKVPTYLPGSGCGPDESPGPDGDCVRSSPSQGTGAGTLHRTGCGMSEQAGPDGCKLTTVPSALPYGPAPREGGIPGGCIRCATATVSLNQRRLHLAQTVALRQRLANKWMSTN